MRGIGRSKNGIISRTETLRDDGIKQISLSVLYQKKKQVKPFFPNEKTTKKETAHHMQSLVPIPEYQEIIS